MGMSWERYHWENFRPEEIRDFLIFPITIKGPKESIPFERSMGLAGTSKRAIPFLLLAADSLKILREYFRFQRSDMPCRPSLSIQGLIRSSRFKHAKVGNFLILIATL